MKKLTLIFGMMFLAIVLGFNCSDNESTGMNEGDSEDDAFVAAKANVDTSITEFDEDMIEAVDSIVLDIVNWGPTDYDTTSGWHYRFRTFENNHWYRSVADSFRFTDTGGEYQYHPDSMTNQFERRMKKNHTYDSGIENGPAWDKTRNRNMNWVGLAGSITTLNGDVYRHYWGQNFRRTFEHTMSCTFEDVLFETEDVLDHRPTHPFDGILEGNLVTDKQLPNRDVHIEAEFTVTFYPDHYHVHLVSGDSYWDWDVYY